MSYTLVSTILVSFGYPFITASFVVPLVVGYQTRTLGSGHHRSHSHWVVRLENNIKVMHDWNTYENRWKKLKKGGRKNYIWENLRR